MDYFCPLCKYSVEPNDYLVCPNCKKGIPLFIKVEENKKITIIHEEDRLQKKCINCSASTTQKMKLTARTNDDHTGFFMTVFKLLILSLNIIILPLHMTDNRMPRLKKKIYVCDNCRNKVSLVFINGYERSFYILHEK